ncbi:LamB/YcsF family protein [Shouchella clausii]|uniref:LamB/YcsF family protein n=1 Tax=Shouchella clausii TaxID=79880 RepID=UPI000A715645|nr:5-oxoprolinase subunit PxpA [Shouchella clausii]
MTTIDLCADVGESFGNYEWVTDTALLDIVSSVNIACGFHAGDPRSMMATTKLAVEKGCAIGAHPGFPDLVGFGRRIMELSKEEITTDVLYQLGALQAFATGHGANINHVLPHGQLANMANVRGDYASAIVDACALFSEEMVIVAPPGQLADEAQKRNFPVAHVAFIDRNYQDNGQLVPRNQQHAVIVDEQTIIDRCKKMIIEQSVTTVSGKEWPVKCDTLLLHGDTSGAVRLAYALREALLKEGIAIQSYQS